MKILFWLQPACSVQAEFSQNLLGSIVQCSFLST